MSSTMSEIPIVLEHVSRWYGPVIGLNDVSLEIPPGVTGLLGPNGAGKSTLIKLVTGQLRPSQGKVHVFGARVFANPRVLARIGHCPDHEQLYEHRSPVQHLLFWLRLAGHSRRTARSLAADALDLVGLTSVSHREVGGFSKGMRQRLRIAQTIAHRPDLVVLDEPLTGLDPVGRREMIDLVRRLGELGASVLLSGHVLHEVQRMTRRVALIHNGRLLAEGTLGEIRTALDRRPHRVRLGAADPRALARELVVDPAVGQVTLDGDGLELEVRDGDGFFDRLLPRIASGELCVEHFETTDDDLQSIFDYLVA